MVVNKSIFYKPDYLILLHVVEFDTFGLVHFALW